MPPQIFLLENLVEFNIKNNLIENIFFEKNIDVRLYNQNSHIGWHNLTKLEILNVSENQIKKMPDDIGNCKQLHTLYLNGNKLCEVPQTLASLVNLKKFSLEWFMYLDPPQ